MNRREVSMHMKLEKRIINCVILLFVALSGMYLNYHFYRFAFQIAAPIAIITGIAILQLFVKRRKNSLYLYLMAACVIIISLINLPKYTVSSAETMISKSLEKDHNEISFSGCAASENEGGVIFHYKNYLFDINNEQTAVFGINSGEIYYIENE